MGQHKKNLFLITVGRTFSATKHALLRFCFIMFKTFESANFNQSPRSCRLFSVNCGRKLLSLYNCLS